MIAVTPSSISFGEAVLPCLDMAYRVAVQLTDSPQQAEDCVTEAALVASRVRPEVATSFDIGPWFLGLVVRSCASRYRRWELPLPMPVADEPALPLYEATRAGQQESAQDVVSSLFARMSAIDICGALQSLPWELRKIATLYYVAGYRYLDLATALDISREQLRPRLHRARRALQVALCARARAAGILPAA